MKAGPVNSDGPVASPRNFGAKTFAGCLALAALLLAYSPALRGAFLWDDDWWTLRLEPLFKDSSALARIWSGDPALQQYYPLTATTFWLDWHLWGWWTTPYHLENVLMHALSALFLGLALTRLRVRGAWLAAVVFAFHPVMVESVAWITERKNLLSLTLSLAAVLAYGAFEGWWRADGKRRWWFYTAAVVLCAAALLAKITAYVIAPSLVLLCWWQRGRVEWRRDVAPLLPFFAITFALGVLTWWRETHHVGAEGRDFDAAWSERCITAGRAFWFYPWKLLLPRDLCFIYPDWRDTPIRWWHWAWPASVLAVLVCAWRLRTRLGRGLVTALLFYLGALFPVMGFMNVYGALFAPVWDHWAYVPAIGVIVPVCVWLVIRWPRAEVWIGVVLALLLGGLTWRQSAQYRDNAALWGETLRRNPKAWIAHNNLGTALALEGRTDDGIAHLQAAISTRPDYARAHANLAGVLLRQGRVEEAVASYQRAIESDPRSAPFARRNIGASLLMLGRVEEAMEHLHAALTLEPDDAETLNTMSLSLLRSGRVQEARERLHEALRARPGLAAAWGNLGRAEHALGDSERAIACLRHALHLEPTLEDARRALVEIAGAEGAALSAEPLAPVIPVAQSTRTTALSADELAKQGQALIIEGRFSEGAGLLRAALDLDPLHDAAARGLADVLLQRGGRAIEAARLLDGLLEKKPADAVLLLNRAIAASQLGNFSESAHFNDRSLEADRTQVGALNNFAWLLATCPDDRVRDGARAVSLVREALAISGGEQPVLQRTLAAALAETGDFSGAVEAARLGVKLAGQSGMEALVKSLQEQMLLYLSNEPVREGSR